MPPSGNMSITAFKYPSDLSDLKLVSLATSCTSRWPRYLIYKKVSDLDAYEVEVILYKSSNCCFSVAYVV